MPKSKKTLPFMRAGDKVIWKKFPRMQGTVTQVEEERVMVQTSNGSGWVKRESLEITKYEFSK